MGLFLRAYTKLKSLTNSSLANSLIEIRKQENILNLLNELYTKHCLYIEKSTLFDQIVSNYLTQGDFFGESIVLLIGQYSTGKTTFIKNILDSDYPGIRIGAEPTTEKFSIIYPFSNCNPQTIPGHAAIIDKTKPWSQLEFFGSAFLSRFEIINVHTELSKKIVFVDTPGILANGVSTSRGYDFPSVMKWFYQRVDCVLLFFDANKLDMNQELCQCLKYLAGYEHKLCIILNKADLVSVSQLIRIYGALMWNLSKVLKTAELPRIFVGTFWSNKVFNHPLEYLFRTERYNLYNYIFDLPNKSIIRKLNDFAKRVQTLHCHIILFSYIFSNCTYFNKAKYYQNVLKNYDNIIKKLAEQHKYQANDFLAKAQLEKNFKIELFKSMKIDYKKFNKSISIIRKKLAALTKQLPLNKELSIDKNNILNYDTEINILNNIIHGSKITIEQLKLDNENLPLQKENQTNKKELTTI